MFSDTGPHAKRDESRRETGPFLWLVYKRLRIPTPPNTAPTDPRNNAGQMPVGSEGRSPLKGTYVDVDEAPPPVPPPVKLAPFGYVGRKV